MTTDRLTESLTQLNLREHEPEIRSQARVSTRLVHAPDLATETIGTSRLGGDPDLPSGFAWPEYEYEGSRTPLSFLAQLDLASLPAASTPDEMPSEGLVSMFYDSKNQPWGFDSDDKGGLVLAFHEAGAPLTRTPAPEGAQRFEAKPLQGVGELTLPESFLDEDVELEGDLDSYDAEEEIRERLRAVEDQPLHRLGGYDDNIQNQLIEDQKTVLLLQLDSDQAMDWMWGDVGCLYVMISREDLASRRFDRATYELQCH